MVCNTCNQTLAEPYAEPIYVVDSSVSFGTAEEEKKFPWWLLLLLPLLLIKDKEKKK